MMNLKTYNKTNKVALKIYKQNFLLGPKVKVKNVKLLFKVRQYKKN